MKKVLLFIICLTLFFLDAMKARADEQIQITQAEPKPGTQDTGKKIEGLTFSSNELIQQKNEKGEVSFTVRITAKLQEADWRLINESSIINPGPDGNLNLVIPMKAGKQDLNLFAISPLGDMQSSSFQITISNWDELNKQDDENRKWRYNAGIGQTYTVYGEDSLSDVTSLSLSVKGGAIYNLVPKKWTLGLSGYFTLLSESHSPATLPAAQFYGINGRVGYHLNSMWLGFDPTVSAGWYYWGMLVANSQYGIANMFGPQIFISGKKEFESKKVLSLYIKYAPISESMGFPSLSNNEMALGGGYTILQSWKYGPLNLTLDVSSLNMTLSKTNHKISLKTVSLGLSKDF